MSSPVTSNKTQLALVLISREQGASLSEIAEACKTEERSVYALVSRVKKRAATFSMEVYKTKENRDTVWKVRAKK